jgi:galactokinase
VEFLGKHTDYAGGRSLLCAAERGFAVVCTPREDDGVHVYDATSNQSVHTSLTPRQKTERGRWSNYPTTVCRRIGSNFPGAARGADIAFASDLPSAAGLSSSSALMIGTYLAVAEVNALPARFEYVQAIRDTEDLAGYLGSIENGSSFHSLAGDTGVGTLGGSQDHTAILCARPHALVEYRFVPVQHERDVPFPVQHVLVVAASGVLASKSGAAMERYNRASARASAALDVWRKATGTRAPTLAAMLAESSDPIGDFRRVVEGQTDLPFSSASLVDRVEQLHEELKIIAAASNALAGGDVAELGPLIDRSQENAERLLGNQVPETIALAQRAREMGAVAASAFGAGFGGSVYALVRESDAAAFRDRWMKRYLQEFPKRAARATFFVTRAGPPAIRLDEGT